MGFVILDCCEFHFIREQKNWFNIQVIICYLMPSEGKPLFTASPRRVFAAQIHSNSFICSLELGINTELRVGLGSTIFDGFILEKILLGKGTLDCKLYGVPKAFHFHFCEILYNTYCFGKFPKTIPRPLLKSETIYGTLLRFPKLGDSSLSVLTS